MYLAFEVLEYAIESFDKMEGKYFSYRNSAQKEKIIDYLERGVFEFKKEHYNANNNTNNTVYNVVSTNIEEEKTQGILIEEKEMDINVILKELSNKLLNLTDSEKVNLFLTVNTENFELLKKIISN